MGTGSEVSVEKDGRAWRVEIGVESVREYTEDPLALWHGAHGAASASGGWRKREKGGLKERGTSRDSWC